MSLMDDIIEKLQGKITNNEKRWINTKTGWNNYNFDHDKKINFSDIINDLIVPKGKQEFRKATNISFVKNNGNYEPYRKEEFLERVLVIANNNLYNQFNISGGKESIDLVYSEKSKIDEIDKIEIIELKEWNSPNSPIYALIEILKNYLILSKDEKIKSKIKKLLIVAPKEYYNNFKLDGNNKSFFELINKIKEENDWIDILIYYIDINYNDLVNDELIKKIKEETNKKNEQNIDLEIFKSHFTNISKLKKNEWKEIKKNEDWLKLI